MKKLAALVVVGAFTCLLIGCGGVDQVVTDPGSENASSPAGEEEAYEEATENEDAPPANEPMMAAPPEDGGFGDGTGPVE